MSLSDRLARHAIGTANELEDDLLEAAATIDTQAAEIERLRASLAEAVGVLRPFGEEAEDWQPSQFSDAHVPMGNSFTVGDLRAARDFITKHSGGERE